MAMNCVRSRGECDGCGECMSEKPSVVGYCSVCGMLIEDGETFYDIEGELVHEDCLMDWAKKYRVELI